MSLLQGECEQLAEGLLLAYLAKTIDEVDTLELIKDSEEWLTQGAAMTFGQNYLADVDIERIAEAIDTCTAQIKIYFTEGNDE